MPAVSVPQKMCEDEVVRNVDLAMNFIIDYKGNRSVVNFVLLLSHTGEQSEAYVEPFLIYNSISKL